MTNDLLVGLDLLTRLLPDGSRRPVARANKPRNEPAPSLHPHYKGFSTTTSRSASRVPRRYSTSPVSAVDALPLTGPATSSTPPGGRYRHRPSHVPCRSRRPGSRRLHAGHHLANTRAPARLIPGVLSCPRFRCRPRLFDTSTAVRSRSPSRSPPDTSRAPFPHRSPR